jgi:hypothetical protein
VQPAITHPTLVAQERTSANGRYRTIPARQPSGGWVSAGRMPPRVASFQS